MLIQAEAFKYLEAFVLKVPCGQEKEFMCGLYAQLERASEAGIRPAKEFLELFLLGRGSTSRHPRVREWAQMVAQTVGVETAVQPVPRSHLQLLRKAKEYASTVTVLEGQDESLPGDLLSKAWEACTEAQVFYADIKIREYYLQDGHRLMVERLSRAALSMDQCYINLAIVEHFGGRIGPSDDGDTSRQSSPFSLLHRLKVEAPQKDMQVDLPSLFSPRKRQDGTEAPPGRILIRGQAGVGKTTLCKKMVHDYLHGKLWPGLFDRLLWVQNARTFYKTS